MASDPREANSGTPPQEGLNVFALVIYIPHPLGRFLDDLRRELVPLCNPHAHVSVLPPRPLGVPWQSASEQVRALAASWSPFDVELGDINVFPVTGVVYIQVGAGSDELTRMHRSTNTKLLAFEEPFVYHPHITLAQEIPEGRAEAVQELATRRWQEYPGNRVFRAGQAVLVQNTYRDCWTDLAAYSFGKSAE
jgi:2'-5' RNA ligase